MWWLALVLYLALSVWALISYRMYPPDLKVNFFDYVFAFIPLIHIAVIIGSYSYYSYRNEFKKQKDVSDKHTSKN